MYVLEILRAEIRDCLQSFFENKPIRIDTPPAHLSADFAVPIFELMKQKKRNPSDIAAIIAVALQVPNARFTKICAERGFLNFTLNRQYFMANVVAQHLRLGSLYGRSTIGNGKTIVIDYSAPNIAKPFSVGHLRSTIIGAALYNIFTFLGYTVIGDNHIGDWGTQFGKLMAAYTQWGDRHGIEKDPINELLKLYVRFHEEAKLHPALLNEGRSWFKKLEDGDPEATALWKWFAEVSWREFNHIYEILDTRFDEVLGESFYNTMLESIVRKLLNDDIAIWSLALPQKIEEAEDIPIAFNAQPEDVEPDQVALISAERLSEGLPLKERITTPLLIQKSDGTSLYATRDIATAMYRVERWNPEQIIYVVGGEQQLYFRQLFSAFRLMHIDTTCVHVWFGLVRLPEGKMSTRRGRIIFLKDVIDEAVRRARTLLDERTMSDEKKDEIARIVGIGAVKYGDLSQHRTRDIVFDWDRILNMQGDSAPYLQYACARIWSLLRKGGEIDLSKVRGDALKEDVEYELIKKIAYFPDAITQAATQYAPHHVANYAYELAQIFSGFYAQVPVLQTDDPIVRHTRLYVCHMTAETIHRALTLLGIECPEQM